MTKPKQTLHSLQFLRAVAVLLVVLSHIRHKQEAYAGTDIEWLGWFNIGEYGVDIFFVISGFIIAYIAPKTRQSGLDVFSFMVKRIIRIFPLYYTVTLIALCVWLALPEMVNSSAPETTVLLPSFFLWPTEGRFLIQTGWTLSYEMYFYILFGATLLLARWQYRILSVYLVSCLFIGIFADISHPVLQLMTNHHLAEFLAGYLFYKLAHKQIGRQAKLGLGLIALGIILIISPVFQQNSLITSAYIWGIPAMMLVYGFLLSEQTFKIPEFFLKIGDSSYSIYLTQAFALPVLTKIWYGLIPVNSTSHFGFILFALASTLGIGFFVYHFYEKPTGLKLNALWRDRLNAMALKKPQIATV